MKVPVRLVYSSAPADAAFREQLSRHLLPLVQNRLLTEWSEHHISLGSDIAQERQKAWQEADILLVLLSADYFASAEFDKKSLQQALERHHAKQLLILPVIVRPCDWKSTLFSPLLCLPRNQQPISKWEHQDDAFHTIEQDLRQIISRRHSSAAPLVSLSTEQKNERQFLLNRVRKIWITDLLEKSLQHAVWIDLHLQERPDVLPNPWSMVVQELDQEPHTLPSGTSILQVFNEADEELLILGEPGSGKTTVLLYVARTLLDMAECDEKRRIPVVFNLSSWAKQRLPLEQWMLEEIVLRYKMPRKAAQDLLNTHQIFPLLDGLDEVEESSRVVCVQAILRFKEQSTEHLPCVICCRTEEYQALTTHLPLQYAVMLLPLSSDQIDIYLSSVSGNLDALRETLHGDQELFELARRPLLLSLFTQAYQNHTPLDLSASVAPEEYPRILFRQYVQQMLNRRAKLQRETKEQAQKWLTYFATQLYQRQSIFEVEELQPSWLPERAQIWYARSMILVYGLTFSLFGGVIFWLTYGIIFGLLDHTLGRVVYGSIFGLLLGLVGGLMGGLTFGLTFRQHRTIRPAEVTSWSWTAASKGLGVGLLGGLGAGLLGGLLAKIIAGLDGALVLGSVLTVLIGLVGGLVGGLAPGKLSARTSLTPNEGIWRSGRRGLIAVLTFAVVVGLLSGWIVTRFENSLNSLTYSLILGITLGAVAGPVYGLAFNLTGGRTGIAAFLQHFVLRFFLWKLDLLPWQLVAFLDEATERVLLRKVGGGYTFVHRLLRDALATQDLQPEKPARRS
ncbi:MAG TPA: TIR domain-containing protein [Ktedonobacteraceae bacterium]|nr:TIR domain-containing protein [Ktedonobacteraceae bacterium]